MKSLTFYASVLLIRILGIKKVFSANPLNYQALRARDVHTPEPREILGLSSRSFNVLKSKITEITPDNIQSEEVILYCPGGSFVSGPAKFNWRSIARIAQDSGRRAYMIDYPKAPESRIGEIDQNLDAVYQHFLDRPDVSGIVLLGGSVGGTLVTLLTQRLIRQGLPLPVKLILITPMMDGRMLNSRIPGIEPKDIMYSRAGVVAANEMCVGPEGLGSDRISPLFGSVRGFPPSLVLVAENDIQRPDAELFCAKLREERVELKLEFGPGQPHIWPLLPMHEGKLALRLIAEFIRS